ncbi:MAG: AAA family ATPase, partial [Clostridia bacterium]|nr:AAA family ATPase [Clostridia bacterium]
MLKYLCIENIAVIEKAEIDFDGGFNVLTGETGAGKSIIIDSINAVLGERTSRDLIRKGCDKASVTAIFGNLLKETTELLALSDAAPDEDGNLLITRTITPSGSTVRINGKTATVGVLKSIGKYLVDIHGQHDSQMLLDADNHCSYIDRMSGNKSKRDDYYAEFKKLNAIRKELNALNADSDEKTRRREYLDFCIRELETAAIEPGEKDRLKEKMALAENFEKTVSAINGALIRISGGDETDGALSLISGAAKSLSGIKSKEAEGYGDSLDSVYAELEGVSEGLRQILDSTESTVTDKDAIAERLDLINRLIKKYGGSEEAVFDFLSRSKEELERIDTSDETRAELSKQLEASTNRLIKLAGILSDDRIKTAEKFSRDVTDVLTYLDMQNVRFKVGIGKGRYTKNGCDVVEFEVKTNVGEDFKPLSKIA